MALQLILGGSGSGKSYFLEKMVIDKSVANISDRFILVVPEQFTMETQRKIVSMHPRGGVFNIDIVSFERLAYRIFEEVNYSLRPVLDDLGKVILLRKVIEEKQRELLVYGKDSDKLGFINEMKSMLSELLQYGVGEEAIEGAIAEMKDRSLLSAKLKDILLIYRSFREAMGDRYIATEELLGILCGLIDKSEIIKNSTIVFDGYTGFTPVQLNVLELLMIHAKDVVVTVTIPASDNYRNIDGKQELFSLSKETISSILNIADKNGIPCKNDICIENEGVRFRNESLKWLEKNLLRFDSASYGGTDDKSVTMYEAFSPLDEIKYIIYSIKKLVEEGYRYRDIAVVSGDTEGYGDTIMKMFKLNGINAFVDDKRNILNNPFIQLIRASLLVSLERFSYDSVFSLLKTGLFSIDESDIDELENYVLATGIKGYSAYNNTWVKQAGKNSTYDLEKLNSIRERFMKIYNPLYESMRKPKLCVEEALSALYEYITTLQIYEKLSVMKEGFLEDRDFVLGRECEAIYGEVMKLFDKLVALSGEDRVTLEVLLGMLDTGFEHIQVGVIPPVLDNVTIGDIERTRLGDIKALFFIGVNEGIIPKDVNNASVLSEYDRDKLRSIDINLAPSKRENAYIQKFYLYLNMTKPSDKLFVSYYKYDFEGKAIGRSYLIGMLEKMFPKNGIKKQYDYPQMKEYVYMPKALCNKKLVQSEKISRQIAGALYGKELYGSVSRVEKYVSCAYAHFLQYGLQLAKRREYEVTEGDIGTIYHEVIKEVTLAVSSSEYTFTDIPDDFKKKIISDSIQKVSANYNNTIMFSSEKNRYMLERLEEIVDRTVWAIGNQLSKGNFVVEGCEVPFSGELTSKELEVSLSNGGTLQINGRIDRIDTSASGDEVLVKVVDYKTYDAKLEYADIFHGLRLQLLVYMKAAIAIEQKKHRGSRVIPSAMLYNVISNPIISLKDEEDDNVSDAKILEKMRPAGLIKFDQEIIEALDNERRGTSYAIPVKFKVDGSVGAYSSVVEPEFFEALVDYAIDKVEELGNEIVDGNIETRPYKKGQKTACEYCDFKGACGFDYREREYQYNVIKKITEDELKEKMKGGAKNGEVDA